MVILLLAMFLNENASRCINIRGVDQLDSKGELVMAVYRISEPVETFIRVDKNGRTRTRIDAKYRCDCGNVFSMQCRSEGKTQSCGCLAIETARKLLTGNKHRETHKATGTPTYKTWLCMKGRCLTGNHVEYHRYGGRGVVICERWIAFENFLSDMGERPDGCSIDRIDPNGNYEPSNCRWATATEQARNTRRNRILTIDGAPKTVAEWSEQSGAAKASNIYNRLDLGWSHAEAVFGRQTTCKS